MFEIEELEHQKHAYLMRLRSLVASQWKMLQEEEAEEAKFKQEINRVQETVKEESMTNVVEKEKVPEPPVEEEAEERLMKRSLMKRIRQMKSAPNLYRRTLASCWSRKTMKMTRKRKSLESSLFCLKSTIRKARQKKTVRKM